MALNLMLHCGANAVERNALSGVVIPAQSGRHYPLPHDYFADMVQDELEEVGLKVVGEAHGLGANGMKYFGMFEVRGKGAAKDYSTVIGIRNALNKRFRASVAVGSGVFVCDNMCFSGDIVVGHKNTLNVMDNLREYLREIMQDVIVMERNQALRYNTYKETAMEDGEAEYNMIEMLRQEIITPRQLETVVTQWDQPDHAEFKKDNVWKLFNAVTESYKGGAIETLPTKSIGLTEMLDDYCEFELPQAA